MSQLRVLGAPSLLDDQGRPAAELAGQTKRLVLLTYLAVGDSGGFRRDSLLAAFWPELDEARARNALRQALAMLRRALGESALPPDRAETVQIRGEALSCDVTAFERALAEGDLPGAVALYRGDFLAGVHVQDMPDIERWIEDRRIGLRRKAVRAALALADQSPTNGNGIGPASWAHKAVTLAPLEEPAWRKLIEIHLRQGNVPAALETYDRLCRLLADEFSSTPSAETSALVSSLRRPREG